MKIQFLGESGFAAFNKTQRIVFNPLGKLSEKADSVLVSKANTEEEYPEAKKVFSLPGEFEISEILIRGFRSENGENTVFKVFFEDMTIVHFGNLSDVPDTKVFEMIGENIDVALINLSEKFPAKKAKELIEKTEPRVVIFGGETKFFAEISGLMSAVKNAEENPLEIQKSKLPDENSDLYILPL